MFKGLDLNGKIVADLACSSGYNSKFILDQYPIKKVFGFDISKMACNAYKKNTGSDAYVLDLTIGDYPYDIKFDVAIIIGGLHHCIVNLQGTFETIEKLLKPNGYLLMVEPNSNCILELVRKIWYKYDGYFESNTERALDHHKLFSNYGKNFKLLDIKYQGGPAYFIIYNSLVFRIPLRMKRYIARPLMQLEYLYNKLPGKFLFPYFIARWQLK